MFSLLLSCSSGLPLDATGVRRAEYEAYIEKNLKLDRLYMKLRETAVGKALLVTPQLIELQSKIAPGFEQLVVAGKTRVVVALEMQDWSRFSISDYKFQMGGIPSSSVKEIVDEQLIRTLYDFSFPHSRVFVVEFEGEGLPPQLKVQTSPGQFEFDLGGES